ncbi:hypothetical protein C5Y96_24970 [Blastopirellula marina]|uniref:Uncharacterized protein n=1 Tax=Blastopirellula marina TaxID=124 RepID=A0A2S8EZL6_9BACT|nr:hypothetical protein C5Y96_24970 [Blastopirellula marina]RCS42252.1 hypothetical protein DTL36_25020 [Bremerella cremea]
MLVIVVDVFEKLVFCKVRRSAGRHCWVFMILGATVVCDRALQWTEMSGAAFRHVQAILIDIFF